MPFGHQYTPDGQMTISLLTMGSDFATKSQKSSQPHESLKIPALRREQEILIAEIWPQKGQQETLGDTTAPAHAGWK